MGQLYLPPLSPLAKAARGWSSSPNVKPTMPVQLSETGRNKLGFFSIIGAQHSNVVYDLVQNRELSQVNTSAGSVTYDHRGVIINAATIQFNHTGRITGKDYQTWGVVFTIPAGGTEVKLGALNGENGSAYNHMVWDAYGTPFNNKEIDPTHGLRTGGVNHTSLVDGDNNFYQVGHRILAVSSWDGTNLNHYHKNLTTGNVAIYANTGLTAGTLASNTEYDLVIGGKYTTEYIAVDQIIESIFVANHAMNEQEFRDIAKDYYGTFLEPVDQSQYFVGLPAAAGAPTLSLPTYSSVTANSATVGCTVTF